MNRQIVLIQAVPVYVNEIQGGGLRLWHPDDPAISRIVSDICRGKGAWVETCQHWLIERPYRSLVLEKLRLESVTWSTDDMALPEFKIQRSRSPVPRSQNHWPQGGTGSHD